MKKALSLAVCLAVSTLSGSLFAGNVQIFSKKNFQGKIWYSGTVDRGNVGRCSEWTEEKIPEDSYGKQLSIRASQGWTCVIKTAGGSSVCVDAEGWGNITPWSNVESADCYKAAYSSCNGSNIALDSNRCPDF